MINGLWVWPSTPKAQKKVLAKVAASPHLMTGLTAISKNKDGLSNSDLDFALGDNSEWMTLWVTRQLTSLGFIDFNVDLFGNAARYRLTDLGRSSMATLTGQPPPAPVKAQAPAPAAPPAPAQPAAPKAA